MIPVMHRINTVKDLKEMPEDIGIETDLRSNGREIILHHDAFDQGESFADFISNYNHKFFIADIKTEGIEAKTIEIIENAGIKDFYMLNVNFPVIVKLSDGGFTKTSVRFSDFECFETALTMKGRADYVFVESFKNLNLTDDIYNQLSRHFKLSLVSPELYDQARIAEIEEYKKKLKGMIHNVCTDFPDKWK